MLNTNLKHVLTDEEFKTLIDSNENVMICCGRMGPMCLPVYDVMENLEPKYTHVQFRDLEFDAPVARNIKSLPECRTFQGLPFTVYFKNGKVVAATSSIQTRKQVTEILDAKLAPSSADRAA